MAHYIQFLDKETKQANLLNNIDKAICTNVLQCEVHPEYYGGLVFDWFNSIGFQLTQGKVLKDNQENSVRNHYKESEIWQDELHIINKIIDYMQEHYVIKTWYRVS